MAKFIVVTSSESDDNFCLQDSYQATVSSTNEKGEPITINNPESKDDYVERRMKEYFVGTAAAGKIKADTEDARKAENESIQSAVADAVSTVKQPK